jgi:hypothetical protein
MQEPPGGPPDFAPPVLLSVTPDSGTVADSLEDHLVFEFDEVINEQSGGGIERLVRLSPLTTSLENQVDVDWRRRALAVRPTDGWRENLVYQVTLLPGVADLRNNRLDSGVTVIFSTGGPIPDTRLSGIVIDWDGNRVGVGAMVEAMLLPDSLTYRTTADSAGEYLLTALPPGRYTIAGVIDGNRNGRRERREPFDTVTVTIDGHLEHVFWAFVQDTAGPQLRGAEWVDSVTVRLQFNQKLEPVDPISSAVRMWALPDTTEVNVAAVYTSAAYDSVRAAEQAARDSIAADADTAGVPADTADVPADTVPVMPGGVAAAQAPQDTLPPSAAQQILLERPALSDLWYLRVSTPLLPDARYLLDATARNVGAVEATSRSLLIVPALPDST